MQYVLLLFLTVFFLKHSIWTVGIAIVSIVFNITALAPLYFPKPTSHEKTSFTVVQVNLFRSNASLASFKQFVKDESPDIIALNEVTASWAAELKKLGWPYKYWYLIPRPDDFGIGILSKWPILDVQTDLSDRKTPPIIAATIDHEKGDMIVIAVHCLPPLLPAEFRNRNNQLNDISKFAALVDKPLVVAGDLNITPFSRIFSDFTSKSKLSQARKGYGYLGTWPTLIPVMFIPIDHILFSEHFDLIDARTGTYIGSDHLPLIAKFSFQKES